MVWCLGGVVVEVLMAVVFGLLVFMVGSMGWWLAWCTGSGVGSLEGPWSRTGVGGGSA